VRVSMFVLVGLLAWPTTAGAVKPIERIKVAKGPYFMAHSPGNNMIYVAAFADSEIQVVDVSRRRVAEAFYGGYEPVGLALTPTGDKLFVSNLGPGLVKIIDTVSHRIDDDIKVGGRPNRILVSPSGLQAFVLNFGRGRIGRVDIIDTSSHRIVAEIEIGVRPLAAVLSSLEDLLFVACAGSNDVYVIDVNRREVVKTISVGLGPDGIDVSPDGLHVYVANSGTNDVSIIDTVDLSETKRIPVGQKPFTLRFLPDGRLLIAEVGDKRVGLYDAELRLLQEFPVKQKPVDMVVVSERGELFVTDELDNRIWVFRLPMSAETPSESAQQDRTD